MTDRKLTYEQAQESFPGVERITDEDIRPIIQNAKAIEIVEKIGKYNITVDGENLKIPANDWVKKNADLIRANKVGIIVYMAELKKVWAQEAKEREAVWAAKQAEQAEIDKPLLEAMQAKAATLRSSVPTGHILVDVKQTGDLDGDPILEYKADGIKLSWQDVNHIGVASAVRPGAMGAFAIERVCSISCIKLAEIKAAKVAAENKKAEAEKAEVDRIAGLFEKARETGERQEIKHYMADCNDPREECSTDVVTIYAMPDGSTKTTRIHTW